MHSKLLSILLLLAIVIVTTECSNYRRYLRNRDSVRRVYKQQLATNVQRLSKDTGGSKEQLFIDTDSQYVAEIGLGSKKAQMFKVVLDAGLANLWVPSKKCYTKACQKHNTYDSNASESYQADGRRVEIASGSGKLRGYLSADDLTLAGVTVKNQTFAEITRLPDTSAQFDGVLGLGFDASSIYNVPTPFHNMLSQKLVSSPIISLYQNLDQKTKPGGRVIFGGINHGIIDGLITYTNVTRKGYWQFKVDSIAMSDAGKIENQYEKKASRNDEQNYMAIIDTTNQMIAGPKDEVKKLNEKIGASEVAAGAYVLPDCNLTKLPNLVITIGGREFSLKPEQYVEKISQGSETTCLSGLIGFDISDLPLWILGNSFVGSFYTVLDYGNERIGFGDMKN